MQDQLHKKQHSTYRDRDDSSQRHERKKKKKHKDSRYERSRSRSESESRHHHKKDRKRYDTRSPERSRNKHKYENKGYAKDYSPDRRYHGRSGDRNNDKDRYRDRGGYRGDRDRRDFNDRRGGGYGDRRDRGGYREGRQKVQKDPYFQQRREIEKIRSSNPQKAQQMENQLEKRIILDQKQREYEQMKQKFKQAQKQMQEAKREDHTIIVYCLPLKAKQKHIWKFFSQAGCGKIRDIRIIKDARSGRSKGVAYVEFYTSDSVQKALTMSQKPFQLKGRKFTSLKVQHSQAQKNRAAAAAKQMKVIKPVDPLEQQQQTQRRQMKVFVGGLTDRLAQIQQSDLKQLFEPFGPIDYVDIHRDPMTGKCKGYAFIQYQRTEDAKTAVRQMNDIEIGSQKIAVQTVSTVQKGNVSGGDDFLHSAGSKAALVNKLSRDAPTHSNLMRPPISTMCTPYLLLTNLFKMEGTTPKFFEDLKKEVMTQCSSFGIVEKCFVEKNNQGNVWVKFSDTQSAIKAQQNLNGKYFDKAKIFCYFVTENTYQTRVGL